MWQLISLTIDSLALSIVVAYDLLERGDGSSRRDYRIDRQAF